MTERRSLDSLRRDRVNDQKATNFDWITSNVGKLMVLVALLTSIGSWVGSYVAMKIRDHDNQLALEGIRAQQADGAVWRRQQDGKMQIQTERLEQMVYFFCATTKIIPIPPFCREVMQKIQNQTAQESMP